MAQRRKVTLSLGAGALGITAVAALTLRDTSNPVTTVALDRRITTSAGRVTAHGWSPSPEPKRPSEADVESCQVEPNGTVIALQRYRLELADGTELEPVGSRLSVGRGAGCVRAIVLFDVADDNLPTAVAFRAEEKTVRWPLAKREAAPAIP